MHKWIVTTVLVAGTGLVLARTSFMSYAGTLWSQVQSEVKQQIPTRFEIERARYEIAQLDKDITGTIRPLAEYKAAVARLDKDIEQTRTQLDDRRDLLLKLTRELEAEPKTIRVGSRDMSAERVKANLDRDFEGFQRLERHAEALRKMRDAKQSAFDGAQGQLSKLVSRKRDFEVRIAQLEADEETLRVAALGSKVAIDDNRASAIEAALKEIERRQQVYRAELELSQGDLVSELTPAPTPAPSPSLSGMRAYLEHK